MHLDACGLASYFQVTFFSHASKAHLCFACDEQKHFLFCLACFRQVFNDIFGGFSVEVSIIPNRHCSGVNTLLYKLSIWFIFSSSTHVVRSLIPILKIGMVWFPALCMAGVNSFMFMRHQHVTVTSTV